MSLPPIRGFHPVHVLDVVSETTDAASFVLEVPDDLRDAYRYEAGQYLTFRIPADGGPVLRCYSMSSAPETGEPLRTTVKRVPGGIGSNWLIDNVTAGDVLEATIPAGRFLLADGEGPVLLFAGGSGITPVLSLVKSALVTTARPIRLLYANRDRASVIFRAELDELEARHPDRLHIVHHLDDAHGYVAAPDVHALLDGTTDQAIYVCGPTPFMDLVEAAVAEAGVAPELVHSERFVQPEPELHDDGEPEQDESTGEEATQVVITLAGKTHEITYHDGDTILETARRGGLKPPFSCQAGNCATCMARLVEGEVRMRVNDALFPEEVADGWILTCQSVPTTSFVRVVYED